MRPEIFYFVDNEMHLLNPSYFVSQTSGHLLLLPVWGYYKPRYHTWSTWRGTGRFMLTVSSRQREEEREAGEGGGVPGDRGQGGLRDPFALRRSHWQKNKTFINAGVCVSSENPFSKTFENYCKLTFISGKNYCCSCYWPVVALSSCSPVTESLFKTCKCVFLLK